MKKKPLALSLYVVVAFSIVLSLPWQAALSVEVPIWQVQIWYRQLTWLNCVMAFVLAVAGTRVLMAKRDAFIWAALAAVLVVINNTWVGYVGVNVGWVTTTLASLGFVLVSGGLALPEVRRSMNHPERQWWRAASRKKVRLAVNIHPWVGDSWVAETHDLSIGGAYICADRIPLAIGDRMQIRLNIDGYKDVRCTARIVRKSTGDKSHPAGFGIQFEDLGPKNKAFLHKIIDA